MENEKQANINIKDVESDLKIENNIQNSDITNENKNIPSESQITNNINNINIVNMIIEKDKIKSSNDTSESNNTFSETKSKIKVDKKGENKRNKNDYFNKNKRLSNKIKKSNNISKYNLDISSIKKFLNFQNKYMKNENNIVETNKCLHAYTSMHPEDKINPIYFYILKNYQKDNKLNHSLMEREISAKCTPRKNPTEPKLENSNINTAETSKTRLSEKAKELVELRKK